MKQRTLIVGACLIALVGAASCKKKEPEFGKDDVEFMEETISDWFKRDGTWEANKVTMMRVSPRRMEGTAEVRLKQLPTLRMTKRCTATMSDIDENRVNWECD